MQRALWKGAISFGLVHIPVQLFSAEKRDELDFTMLDKRDFAPIGYKRINKETGKEVDWENIIKGFEYEPDQYVVLSDEDFQRANVEATKTIDILGFVDVERVPLIHYEQPYYLTPDKGGDKVYALLRETLRRSGKIGIAQVVIRTRQHLSALVPIGDAIVLNTLRYADEIRPTGDFDLPKKNLRQMDVTEKEVKMALSLVEGMTQEWDPARYHNSYREDVLAMVQKKIDANQTKTIAEAAPEEPPRTTATIIDLMALLKESLNAQGGKVSARASHEKAAPPTKAVAKKKAGTAVKSAAKTAAKSGTAAKSKSRTAQASQPDVAAKPGVTRRARA